MGVAFGFWSWSNDFSRECLALVADRSLSGGRVTRELTRSGSWLTWRVSRPLIAMNAERYAREAELRFAVVRISESAEDIPLHGGAPGERPAGEP